MITEKILYSRSPVELNLKVLLPLSLLYLTVYFISDSVAYKLVELGPLLEPGPPFIFPLTYAIADVIAEVYGSKQARKIIFLTLALQIFYAICIVLIINLPSPKIWAGQEHYEYVFGHLLRFVLGGTFAVLISNMLNIYVISKLKWVMQGRKFWIRGFLSSALGGLTLVTIIILIGYSNVLSIGEAVRMWFSINALEMIFVLILLMPVWAIANLIKRIEKVDVYENIYINPFKNGKY